MVPPQMQLSRPVLVCRHGESERSLVALFQLARQLQPALIFIVSATLCRCVFESFIVAAWALQQHVLHVPGLSASQPDIPSPAAAATIMLCCPCIPQDELDSLGGARGGGEDPSARRLLVELLLQMTRMEQEQSVYIFAATNRVQVGSEWAVCLL